MIRQLPSWLEDENPDWEGNYRVKYWEAEWQKIISTMIILTRIEFWMQTLMAFIWI